jgi:hypothetical protein
MSSPLLFVSRGPEACGPFSPSPFCLTPIGDFESFPLPGTESPSIGPVDHLIVRSTYSAKKAGSVGSRSETVNPVEFPSRAGSSKIPAAVFPKTQSETRTERPRSGSDSCCY